MRAERRRTARRVSVMRANERMTLKIARRLAPFAMLLVTSTAFAQASAKDEARKHFERGITLYQNGTFDAALLEFRESFQTFPTRAAGQNFGIVLKKLGRFLEAEEVLKKVLVDFKDMKAEDRAFIEKELAETTSLIGTLEVRPSEADASVVVDGKEQPKGPVRIRVNSGSHRISVFKEGYASLELPTDVEGGKSVVVDAKLKALIRGGRLSVSEDGGAKLDVIVDDRLAGKTPWEGTVEEGRHVVYLRGEGDLGSMPVAVEVKLNQRTKVQLVSEPLECALRVEPSPASASVVVDGIEVGRGNWQGKVRCGGHQVEIGEEAFIPFKKDVGLTKGKPPTVLVQSLERDLTNPKWMTGRPSHFAISISATGLVGLGLGGPSCTGNCSAGLPLGGVAVLRPSYELSGGLGVGLDVGYVYFSQKTEGRAATLAPRGQSGHLDLGTADDDRSVKGPLIGVSVGYERGENFLLRGRLGAGLTLGRFRDARTGAFQTYPAAEGGVAYQAPQRVESGSTIAPTVSAEVAAGYRIGKSLVLDGGLRGFAFFGLGSATWSDKTPVISGNCSDPLAHDDPKKCGGEATYGKEALFGNALLLLGPFVGARYEF